MQDWYTKAREAMLSGGVNIPAGDVRCILVDEALYSVDLDADEFLSDVPAGARGGTPVSLTSKTVTGGVFDAADAILSGASGGPYEAIVIYLWSGDESTSRLLLYLDGKTSVEVAVAASSGATSVVTEDLPEGAANGATLTLVSGTGPATITLSAEASAGSRAINCNALSSGVSAGAQYEYRTLNSTFPTPSAPGYVALVWSNGPNRIARV